MGLALVSPSQSISFGVKPDLSAVVRCDNTSRMNGAQILPGWRLKPGSHKDISAVTGVKRPASFPTEQISRNAPIATSNQFTFSGFCRDHHLHIRPVLEPGFKQRCEQAGLTIPLYSLHNPFLSLHVLVCVRYTIATQKSPVFLAAHPSPASIRSSPHLRSLALDVLQELAQGQPTQLKGFLDGEDGDLLPLCGHPLLRRLWRGKEMNVVAERRPDLLDRFQPTRPWLWNHDGNDGAFGLEARHALR